MRIEHKEKLEKYSELKLKIKELEAEADLLNPEILTILDESELEEVQVAELGKISKAFRRTWKYVAEIENIKKEYETKSKEAQQTGIGATYTEKPYIIFKKATEEEY